MAIAEFTVADVLAWARTKPADELYDYCDADNCAVAQFGRATGREYLVHLMSDDINKHCPGLLNAANPYMGPSDAQGWTFADFVKRLEALLPAKPLSDTWTRADAYLTDIEQVQA